MPTCPPTIPGTHLNGDAAQRLPGNVNITFDGVEAETLLLLLDEAGICASAGSACSAGAVEPSHVLLALGLTPAQAKSTLRLTLDAANTAEEIDTAAAVITGRASLRDDASIDPYRLIFKVGGKEPSGRLASSANSAPAPSVSLRHSPRGELVTTGD